MNNITSLGLTPQDIVDYFLNKANETGELITNLKLQKLIFYAQAWYLALNGQAIFDEDFEAWVHGPVIPQIYVEYKQYGSKPIPTDNIKFDIGKFDEKLKSFLELVTKAYFFRGAYELELMTHNEQPWQQAREGIEPLEQSHKIIEKEAMRDYYLSRTKGDISPKLYTESELEDRVREERGRVIKEFVKVIEKNYGKNYFELQFFDLCKIAEDFLSNQLKTK